MNRDLSALELITALVTALAACNVENIELASGRHENSDSSSANSESDGSFTVSQEAGTGGSSTDASEDSRELFCQGRSNLLAILDNSSGTPSAKPACMGQWASQTFRYALCSCKDIELTGVVTTSAYDSRVSPCIQTSSGGSVGVNETLNFTGTLSVGGSATVAGDQGWTMSPGVVATINGDLRVRGPLNLTGTIGVKRNVWLGGSLLGSGILNVDGDLTQATGAERSPSVWIGVTGRDEREQVKFRQPCECSDGKILDIAGIINEARGNNQNAQADFAINSLENLTGTKTVRLPCGRIFVSKIVNSGALTLQVQRRSAVFVDGDVISTGSFIIAMDPDATLDLFIGGTLSLSAVQSAGSPPRPAKLRIYVAGSEPIKIPDLMTYAASLYAPQADVEIGIGTVCGSIFAGNIKSSATTAVTTVTYDSSLLDEGKDCNPPPTCSNSCDDCPAALACINGQCSKCQTDRDCCEPLICSQGQCTGIIL